MTNTMYFCKSFQSYGRHDWHWQETTENHEVWECSECERIERDEIEPMEAA